jgi:hypothetical protein
MEMMMASHFNEDRDEDLRREAIDERRRRRWRGCLCPGDMPGFCPGAEQCPLHGETMEDEDG